MAVLLGDVRTMIQDYPKSFPPGNEDPYFVQKGDGVTATFYLPHANIVPNSTSMYEATLNTTTDPPTLTWVGVATNAWAQSAMSTNVTGVSQALVTFTTPPAVGVRVGTRYQAVMFSDAELQTIMNRNTEFQYDDRIYMLAIQRDVIQAMLMNINLLKLSRYGDVENDAQAVIRGMTELRAQILLEIEAGTATGQLNPAAMFGGIPSRPYQPMS